MEGSEVRWNIFARELQDMMRERDKDLGIIDDRTKIHQEKVRRLQKSLLTPKRFPLLNPLDLDMLIKAFELSPDEILRLRAAILATSVEATLMGRIHQRDALRAAEQVFEITVEALRNDAQAAQGLGSVRGDDGYTQPREENDLAAIALEPALAGIDWGTLSLHLAQQSSNHAQRVMYLHQARTAFDSALQAMDTLEDAASASAWREEARHGLATAEEELEDSGWRRSG